jgi:hypothetical protein
MDFGAFLNDLRRRSAYQDQIVHARFLPGGGPIRYAGARPSRSEGVAGCHAIEHFYTHQVAPRRPAREHAVVTLDGQ